MNPPPQTPDSPDKLADVFISHATADAEMAMSVCVRLESEGLRCWVCSRDLPAGHYWDNEIPEALDQCRALVLIWSSHADSSDNVLDELRLARDNRIPILPFSIETHKPSRGFRLYLSRPQWIDATKPPLEPCLDRLVRGLTKLLGGVPGGSGGETAKLPPPSPPPAPASGPAPGKSFIEQLGNGVELEMVWIPGGKFRMGSPENEPERHGDEGPVHEVTLDGFWLGATAVTQAQYQQVTGYNPSNFDFSSDLSNPVEKVSWNNAVECCRKLAQLLEGRKYRLQTEAEWEYACRAGSTTPFSFGISMSTDEANYDGNNPYYRGAKGVDRRKTVAVRRFAPNGWGLYEMHGNVWEWCSDWYVPYSSRPARNPAGPDSGGARVVRGGSWIGSAGGCRSACRSRRDPDDRYGDLGFRFALSQQESGGVGERGATS